MSLGEPNVKRALDWILGRLTDDPHAKRGVLIDEASREFDLTPLETDFLYRQLSEAMKRKAAEGPPDQARS
jgi:hypothetical protein